VRHSGASRKIGKRRIRLLASKIGEFRILQLELLQVLEASLYQERKSSRNQFLDTQCIFGRFLADHYDGIFCVRTHRVAWFIFLFWGKPDRKGELSAELTLDCIVFRLSGNATSGIWCLTWKSSAQ